MRGVESWIMEYARSIARKTLRWQRLMKPGLAFTGIGAVAVVLCSLTVYGLRRHALLLAHQHQPAARQLATANTGLELSVAASAAWVATGDPGFKAERARAWEERIQPAVQSLRNSKADPPNPRLVALQQVLRDINALQSEIEQDSSIPSGGQQVARTRLLTEATPRVHAARELFQQLATTQTQLVQRDAQSVARWSNAALFSCWICAGTMVAAASLLLRRQMNRFHRQTKAFCKASLRMVTGKLDEDVPFPIDEELGSLTWEFNQMRASLQRTYKELSQVQYVLQERNNKLQSEILERIRIEKALRESEMRFDLAIRGSSDGLWDWNISTNVVWYSPRFKELLGYSENELSGTFATWEGLLHPEDRQPTLTALASHVERSQPFDVEYRLQTRDKGYRWFRARGLALRDAQGQAIRMAGSIHDITEFKRIERELLVLNNSLEQRVLDRTKELDRRTKELENKNNELDQFTYVASHDLQEPLRKMISFSQLLEQDIEGDLNPTAQRDLHYITDAARRMQKLVQDLLAFSRSGRSAMKWELISLDECVDRALESLAAPIEATGAEIHRDLLPDVYGDATMLTQLYQNLIGNALKFGRDGNRTVELTAELHGDRWILGVRDNGIGIEQEYLKQIFAPFHRLHRREEYEGTGIGLAICQKAVERHGGQIWAESEFGVGSHFKFTLQPAHVQTGGEETPCMDTTLSPVEQLSFS